MYLTCFRVNTARVGARKLLGSPQAMHAAVLSGFPGILPSDSDTPRVLWRLDRNGPAEVFLYVLSPDRPDLTHLVEQAGWPKAGGDGWRTKDYAPFLAKLAAGERWAFRLTANPVHKVRTDADQKETRVTAHVTWRHQVDWLLKREERCGFRVLRKAGDDEYAVTVRDRRRLEFGKGRGGSRGKPVTLASATFDGRLEVTDPGALRHTLTAGLGRAKGYGCGLMTLAPLDEGVPR